MSIDKCIDDALLQLKRQSFGPQENTILSEDECEIFVWPQTWNDASCGQGGMALQVITTKPTVVVIGPMDDACVYHGEKFAYKIDHLDEKLRKAIDNKNLPGRIEELELERPCMKTQ